MYTRNLVLKLLVIFSALAVVCCSVLGGAGVAGGVPGSGHVQTETRQPGSFEAISLEYPADVTIRQGEQESVVMEAEDNLLRQLSSDVSAGRLTIKTLETDWKARVNPSKPVKITITVRNPTEIVFSAPTGSLEADGLHAGTLRLVLSGASQVRLSGLQVDLLDSVLSGAGDLQAGGTADEVSLILSGAGSFNGAALNSNKVTVEISGMGDATVHAELDLAAKITGAGSVKYFGRPRVVQSISGAGSVKPAE